jgi:peptide/nickel transport system substrate-binding protein
MAARVALIALTVLTFLAEPVAAQSARPLRIGIGSLPHTGDPNFDTSLFAHPFYEAVFETLVTVREGRIEPRLATRWQLIDDRTWEFTLRDGVTFHNGEVFNAEAVKWNLERVLNPATKSARRGRVNYLTGAEVLAPNKVRLKSKEPYGPFLPNLTYLWMIPPRHFQQVGQDKFNRMPIGTGPFKVSQWQQDERVVVEAHDRWWGGKTRLARIEYIGMPEAAARVAALEAGDVDLVYAVPPEQTKRLEGAFQVVANAVGHSMVITLRNTDPGSPLADRRVRQAINYAVDKDAIIKALLGGYARKLEGQLVGPDAVGFQKDLKAYPYDPARARQLLAEAGHASGFTVKMQGSQGRYIKDKEVEEAIVIQLAKVGIKADLTIYESGVWLDRWQNNTFDPMTGVALLYAPASDVTAAVATLVPGMSVVKAFNLPRTTELYARQVKETDPARRATALRELAVAFHEEAPVLFLYQVPGIQAAARSVKNLAFRSDYSLENIQNLTIEK